MGNDYFIWQLTSFSFHLDQNQHFASLQDDFCEAAAVVAGQGHDPQLPHQ